MKWTISLALLLTAAISPMAKAQLVVPIGHIPNVADSSPTVWGMSGMEMIKVTATSRGMSPISRTEVWDARTTEILSRVQAPPLRAGDIKLVSKNGRELVVVRRYLLAEVMPEDAQASGMSKRDLAMQWVKSVRRVLPLVAPAGSRFGI